MRVVIAWWDLHGSGQTVASLREFLRTDGMRPWAALDGLWLKCWLADEDANRWGAVMFWESDVAPERLPPHRALELIGYPPTERVTFTVQAAVGDGGLDRFPAADRHAVLIGDWP